jgi:hypothetical protein
MIKTYQLSDSYTKVPSLTFIVSEEGVVVSTGSGYIKLKQMDDSVFWKKCSQTVYNNDIVTARRYWIQLRNDGWVKV